jgi:hypothetical protein
VSSLLLLAIAELFVRGPLRFAQANSFNDFISPYIQTQAWEKGLDPFLVRSGSALEQLQKTNHLVAAQHSWWWTHL